MDSGHRSDTWIYQIDSDKVTLIWRDGRLQSIRATANGDQSNGMVVASCRWVLGQGPGLGANWHAVQGYFGAPGTHRGTEFMSYETRPGEKPAGRLLLSFIADRLLSFELCQELEPWQQVQRCRGMERR